MKGLRVFGISMKDEDYQKLKDLMESMGTRKRSEVVRVAINTAWLLLNGKSNQEVKRDDRTS